MKDLSKGNKDYASFLPAVSTFYTTMLSKAQQDPTFVPENRIPEGFENGLAGLNFLDSDKGYFFYNKALYSAGHAHWDIAKSTQKEAMIQNRNKSDTVLVADSGGFQIGRGVIKFDWDNFYEKKTDTSYIGDADKTRMAIIKWMEHTAEWSMIFDIPTWACDINNRKRTKLTSFKECLDATLYNNDFFVKNRTEGATKFLNVLQGGDFLEAQTWYDAVKHFPFEGWAFGGNNMCDMGMALRRLIVMRDEGMLTGKDWIHFLGTSKLNWACMLTAVQREIRKTVNPNVTISFDCASPFIAVANGLTYTDYIHTPDRWSYLMASCPDDKSLKNSKLPFPFESEIGKRLTMGDICAYGPGDLNKINKEGKTSWDSFSYMLIMAHSVYQHIRSVQIANQLVDVESAIIKPHVNDWKKLKGKDKSGELSQWVPRNLLYFNTFVSELFSTEKPFDFLDRHSLYLDDISRRRSATGNNMHFNTLFDEPVMTEGDDDQYNDESDEKLQELENLFNKGE